MNRFRVAAILIIAWQVRAQAPPDPHQGHQMGNMAPAAHAGMAGHRHMGSNEAGENKVGQDFILRPIC